MSTIVLVSLGSNTGTDRQTDDLFNLINSSENDVILYALFNPIIVSNKVILKLLSFLSRTFGGRFLALVIADIVLYYYLKEKKNAVVFCFLYPLIGPFSLLNLFTKKYRYLFFMPELMWKKKYISNAYWIFFSLFVKFGFRVCDKILVPTVSTYQDLYTNFNSRYHSKIEIFVEYCNADYWRNLDPIPIERLNNKEFIFHPSGLKPSKNTEKSLKAFLEMNTHRKYYFVLLSNKTNGFFSKNRERFIKMISDDNVVVLDSVSDHNMKWLYVNCKLVSVTSIEEGVGLPVLEASYFNKPTVISIASALPQTSNCNGYYVNPFSVESIRNAYESILSGGKNKIFYEQMTREELSINLKKMIG